MASADDSYLYWMIGDTTPYEAKDYDTVRVAADNGSGTISYLTLYGPGGDSLGQDVTTVSSAEINALKSDGQALYAKLISGTSYSSFFIELLNDNKLVAQSETLSYSAAVADYYITTGNSMSLPNMWAASTFAIPEPNSGLLMLVGMAVLGLRRRKLKKA